MDPEAAVELLQRGAVAIVQQLPPGTEFGLDYHSWRTTARFQGVKMLPPGLHLFFTSAVEAGSAGGMSGPRTAFLRWAEPMQVFMFRWNAADEMLVEQQLTEEDAVRVRAHLQDLDRDLAAYVYDDTFKKWLALTNCISRATLQRCQPPSGVITSVTAMEGTSGFTSRRDKSMAVESEDDKIGSAARQEWRDIKPIEAMRLRLVEVPRRLAPPGASASDISMHQMDRSFTLESLLHDRFANNPKELLGELQFAFICFLMCQVYDAFENWKHMVHLLCSCDRALRDLPQLYLDFFGVLHYQLLETPSDFFVDIVSHDNFLVHSLASLFRRIREQEAQLSLQLVDRAVKFRRHVSNHFQWDFDGDNADGDGENGEEEDGPTVVDLGSAHDGARTAEEAPPTTESGRSFYTVFRP